MSGDAFDVIVIGSGIGGLGCAAALARFGHKVAVFEKQTVAGGFTHTFERDGYAWDVGVHYLGQAGPGQPIRRLLGWIKAPGLKRWWGRTTAEVIDECTRDPRPRAVLCAQWGDHGGKPSRASFAVHYLDGARTPTSLRRSSPTWTAKRPSRKRPGGRRVDCSTRRGDNSRMTSFGLCRQRHSHGGGWPEHRRGEAERAGATVSEANSAV